MYFVKSNILYDFFNVDNIEKYVIGQLFVINIKFILKKEYQY